MIDPCFVIYLWQLYSLGNIINSILSRLTLTFILIVSITHYYLKHFAAAGGWLEDNGPDMQTYSPSSFLFFIRYKIVDLYVEYSYLIPFYKKYNEVTLGSILPTSFWIFVNAWSHICAQNLWNQMLSAFNLHFCNESLLFSNQLYFIFIYFNNHQSLKVLFPISSSKNQMIIVDVNWISSIVKKIAKKSIG